MAWTADSEDPAASVGEAALSKLMSYNPSRLANISSNLRMRIPISLTQKWYYLRGSEDKDVEYGKIFVGVVSPLSNVTGASTTSIVIRIRWCFEFSYPDLPSTEVPDDEVFASAPNYFTDSSGDWKDGKYLTFKWHEGGNIVEFPGAKPKTIYKVGANAQVSYYNSNGTVAKTEYAVCVTETTETGLPMLAPVKSLSDAQEWVKNPSDNKLISYYYAGPWVTPENPPWHEQASTIQLLLTREAIKHPMVPTQASFRVHDNNAQSTAFSTGQLNKLQQNLFKRKGADPRDPDYGLLSRAAHAANELNETLNVLMERKDHDPQDPQVGDLEKALAKLRQLEFSNLLIASPLKVFNYNPVRGNKSDDEGGSSSSFEDVGASNI